MTSKIGFIGSGNMASAIIKGIINSGQYHPATIFVSNPSQTKLDQLQQQYPINITNDNLQVVAKSDIILLCVKPNKYQEVLQEIKDHVTVGQVIVSIAAGISLDYLNQSFDQPISIIKTMPNTPVTIGQGMTGICPNQNATNDHLQQVVALFNTIGKTQIIDENLMDIFTAIAGSSPAMVFMMIEAMADAAVLKGMNRTQAYQIISQAIQGAAQMVSITQIHPGQLKDQVTSPKGTTIEAIYTLEQHNFRGTIMQAMEQCANKAGTMTQQYTKKKI
jgi:pyrroline-5-carboxylate reductase